jgi:hypothetical protein
MTLGSNCISHDCYRVADSNSTLWATVASERTYPPALSDMGLLCIVDEWGNRRPLLSVFYGSSVKLFTNTIAHWYGAATADTSICFSAVGHQACGLSEESTTLESAEVLCLPLGEPVLGGDEGVEGVGASGRAENGEK